MAYAVPSTADFKARFPAFSAVDDAVVQSALDEAALMVDDTWLSQSDFTQGRMLYAAHVLTLDGHGTSPEAQTASLAGYKSIKSGTFSVERESGAAGGGNSGLSATSYGQRFLSVLRRNKPAVLVV